MTVNLIIAGDLHFRGSSPRARTDDFPAALTAKAREVYYLAAQHDAAAIIIPGDLFDSPGAAYSTVADLAELLKEAPCPILTIPGNHDMWGGNPETIGRTPYGLLQRLKLFHDLSRYPWTLREGGKRLVVTGTPFSANTDRGPGDYLVPEAVVLEGLFVHVAHGMLLERSPGFDLRHSTFDDLLQSEEVGDDSGVLPRVLVVGHEHIGFGIKQLQAPNWPHPVTAINPGALCRLTAASAEIERRVQVCLLTLFGQSAAVYPQLIPLQSAKPGPEVLSREHLEAQAAREELIARFLDLLEESGEIRFLEVRDIIDSLAASENLPRDVVDEALHRIGRAREELAQEARAT